jgi:ankyrin repeat protein
VLLRQADLNVNFIDEQGCTALFHATRIGPSDIVAMLLEHKDVQFNKTDCATFTALLSDVKKGHKEL